MDFSLSVLLSCIANGHLLLDLSHLPHSMLDSEYLRDALCERISAISHCPCDVISLQEDTTPEDLFRFLMTPPSHSRHRKELAVPPVLADGTDDDDDVCNEDTHADDDNDCSDADGGSVVTEIRTREEPGAHAATGRSLQQQANLLTSSLREHRVFYDSLVQQQGGLEDTSDDSVIARNRDSVNISTKSSMSREQRGLIGSIGITAGVAQLRMRAYGQHLGRSARRLLPGSGRHRDPAHRRKKSDSITHGLYDSDGDDDDDDDGPNVHADDDDDDAYSDTHGSPQTCQSPHKRMSSTVWDTRLQQHRRDASMAASVPLSSSSNQINVRRYHSKPIVLLQNLDRCSVRLQAVITEVLVHRHVLLNNKFYALKEPLICIATISQPADQCNIIHALVQRFIFHTIIFPTSPVVRYPQNIPNVKYSLSDIELLKNAMDTVYMENSVQQYLRDIVIACRQHPSIKKRPLPEATKALTTAAQ